MSDGTRSIDDEGTPEQGLTPAARRALAEARERREEAQRQSDTAAHTNAKQREVGGPAGPEPTRYGDWERKGIASDF